MKKPIGYDEAKIKQYFKRPNPGYYVCKILGADNRISKRSSRDMLVLALDIAEGPFKGYFTNKFKQDIIAKPDKKYPFVAYVTIEGDDETVEKLKTVIHNIEESNKGYTFDWDEKTLVGKIIGCAICEEEFNIAGMTTLKPAYLISALDARTSGDREPPKRRVYNPDNPWNEGYSGDEGYGDAPVNQCESEEDLPF